MGIRASGHMKRVDRRYRELSSAELRKVRELVINYAGKVKNADVSDVEQE